MSIKLDVTKRIEWLKKRMTISELDEEYIRLQIMEAMMEALEKGQSLPIDSVSHCSKGKLAEEFQKGYKEGYEDGANAAANDIAANPHKMY
ncbi:hypothetical protein JJL45_05310 [Tamlana sp. s12]|uniref:hypothetical protein n=1 Tax=Tamlana sp. s12 TaxID=1630406 RepID=UPI0007FDADCD|nr:hypothetical protein [Tamlana sp. s12]OBQ56077.1 hypothetical protein VQ01_06750 [Tamlana sp. s12]QQY83410.1 hypothetical protein JJL45_05310 [Tamlana sp. s12]